MSDNDNSTRSDDIHHENPDPDPTTGPDSDPAPGLGWFERAIMSDIDGADDDDDDAPTIEITPDTDWRSWSRAEFIDRETRRNSLVNFNWPNDPEGEAAAAAELAAFEGVLRDIRRWPSCATLGDVEKRVEQLEENENAVLAEALERADAERARKADEMQALLMSSADLAQIPNPVWLVKNIFETSSVNWIFGPPGGGKTFVALDIAAHVSLGRPWCGKDTRQGKVVYVAAEGISGFKLRVAAWERHHGVTLDDMLFYPESIQTMSEGVIKNGLEESDKFKVFREVMRRVQPAMIILDTQARVTVAMNENSNQDASVFVEVMENLRTETEAAVVLVHHTPKGDGANSRTLRGASALDGAAVTEMHVQRVREAGVDIRATCAKQKNDEEFEPIDLVFRRVDVSDLVPEEPDGRWSAVTAHVNGEAGTDMADLAARYQYDELPLQVREAVQVIPDVISDRVRAEEEKTGQHCPGVSTNRIHTFAKRPNGSAFSKTHVNSALEALLAYGQIERSTGPRNAIIYRLVNDPNHTDHTKTNHTNHDHEKENTDAER